MENGLIINIRSILGRVTFPFCRLYGPIATLIGTLKGSRPAGTVVGQPFGADAVNAATDPLQRGVIEALGLGVLATIAVTSRSEGLS